MACFLLNSWHRPEPLFPAERENPFTANHTSPQGCYKDADPALGEQLSASGCSGDAGTATWASPLTFK